MPHSPFKFYKKMAIAKHLLFGIFGENKAVKYLKKCGLKIIKRNYKCPVGEVDIIAEDAGVLAFIEVKARSSTDYGLPNQAVDAERKHRYKNCVRYYFKGREIDVTVRFDVVEVDKDGNVNHIKNAF